MKQIHIKRIYELAENTDGYRLLIDRLWPRGMSKDKARINEWCKEIAPSTELRKWFDHKEERFEEFIVRYKEELSHQKETLERILKITAEQPLCLLYGAKDTHLNQAVVLKKILENMQK